MKKNSETVYKDVYSDIFGFVGQDGFICGWNSNVIIKIRFGLKYEKENFKFLFPRKLESFDLANTLSEMS